MDALGDLPLGAKCSPRATATRRLPCPCVASGVAMNTPRQPLPPAYDHRQGTGPALVFPHYRGGSARTSDLVDAITAFAPAAGPTARPENRITDQISRRVTARG
ncbi:hypothetical protein GCM10009754_00120 [Amycolatopsis minnesotensis]|uniref:Uncharacterized protein n=1 Tax=Amycolatopsis minnesotensis TaxID=337894 RepID=A0ABN2PXB3_9PSEU